MNRALLVGINAYDGSPLQGCVNDVTDMANLLVSKFGFADSDIRLLTDKRATKVGIMDRLSWLLSGVRAGDRLLFHYSGHGAQMATRSATGEVDGLDEVICPVDFDWTDQHAIRDKEFHALFSTVPNGVEFVWVSDSCHSGDLSKAFPPKGMKAARTIKCLFPPADLAWRARTAASRTMVLTRLGTTKGYDNVALIAGCKSNQTSEDAVFNNRPNGALTYFLIKRLKAPKKVAAYSLAHLVKDVRADLHKQQFDQDPQLEGSPAIESRGFLVAPKAGLRA